MQIRLIFILCPAIMDKEKLNNYLAVFKSDDTNSADQFEKEAFAFRNEFVKLKYDVVQPDFDKYFKASFAIANHYRPAVQTVGCDCLSIIATEAAPAQIIQVGKDLVQSFDKLIQVAHNEVMPALLPILPLVVQYIFESPSSQEFHEFFMHYLETWQRDATDGTACYAFVSTFVELMPYLGLCAARYLRPAVAIINKRIRNTKSRAHILQNIAAINALCTQAWIVASTHSTEILSIVEYALENGQGNELIENQCESIKKILANPSEQPHFPDNV